MKKLNGRKLKHEALEATKIRAVLAVERRESPECLLRDLKRGMPISPIVLTPEEIKDRKRHGDQFIAEILETGIRV